MEHNLLRTVIDIIPDHVFVRDRALRHLINNRAQLDLLRAKTLEETIGKTDFDFHPPKLARQFSEDNERVMALGQTLANIEEMIPGPAGEENWWSTTKVPLRDRDGNVIGLVGIGRNITERRQAVQKITEQAAMLDQANETILLLSLDNRITYMNAAAESSAGMDGGRGPREAGPRALPRGGPADADRGGEGDAGEGLVARGAAPAQPERARSSSSTSEGRSSGTRAAPRRPS